MTWFYVEIQYDITIASLETDNRRVHLKLKKKKRFNIKKNLTILKLWLTAEIGYLDYNKLLKDKTFLKNAAALNLIRKD